jgi:NNP family nitrate/nitrite transporter-like MFS transporter
MLGLLNVVFRPLGGFVGDVVYKYTKSVWAKKIWLVSVCISFSIFLLAIGFTDTKGKATLFGLVTGYAFFMAAANGANFAVVPHVHPFANGMYFPLSCWWYFLVPFSFLTVSDFAIGIVSGIVGAFGNLGGIVFAIVFRYNGTDYHRSIWIIGAVSMAVNVLVAWIAPIPKGQVGGR